MELDIDTLTGYLREAERHHADHGAAGPQHHWSHWYAAYIDARRKGITEDEACDHADRYLQQEIHWY